MEAERIISKAKEHLILFHPFFSYLALQFEFVPDAKENKGSIDGKTIFYNPNWIETISVRRCVTFIAHEILHVLLFHHLRLDGKNFDDWNKACDYVINLILKDSGFLLDDNCLIDEKYRGMDAENVYELIKTDEDEKEEEPPTENDNSDSEGDESDDGSDDTNGSDDSGSDESVQDSDEQVPEESKDGSKDKDGSAENKGNSEKEQPSDFGKIQRPPEGINEREHEAEITQMAVEASIQAEMAGEYSDGLKQIVENLKEPKQDWRDVLREHVSIIAKSDYNWNRANRSYLQRGIYIPSLNNLVFGGIAFAVDNSISMDNDVLNQVFSEVQEASELFTEDLLLIQCDTKVQKVDEVSSDDIPNIEIVGRGGTRFSPVFEYIEDNDIDPKALVYLTDGYCYETLQEPDYPVIWIIYNNPNFKAQFGDTIIIDN